MDIKHLVMMTEHITCQLKIKKKQQQQMKGEPSFTKTKSYLMNCHTNLVEGNGFTGYLENYGENAL